MRNVETRRRARALLRRIMDETSIADKKYDLTKTSKETNEEIINFLVDLI